MTSPVARERRDGYSSTIARQLNALLTVHANGLRSRRRGPGAVSAIDLVLFHRVVAFLIARFDETNADCARSYANSACYSQHDIQAKVRIMNRAFDARVLAESAPDDPTAQAVLATYDTVLRHLAQTYDIHPDYQQAWRPGSEE